MSERTDKKREGIVALTHSEIMLVLAVVILLLLLAKGFALTESQRELAKSEERIALLERITPDGAEQRQEMADIGEQVTDILIRGGIVNDDGENHQLGESPVVASVNALVEEKRRNDATDEVIDDILAKAGAGSDHSPESTNADSEQGREEKITRLEEHVNKTLADADALRRENENLMATINAIGATGENQQAASREKSLKDKIGCLPCWLGDGKPRYYKTYDITYYVGADNFQISPHRDWRAGVDIIDRALNGGMPSLKAYPRGRISRETLLNFGNRLNKEKQDLYDAECKLAIDINDEANGKVIKFVRDQVGLCPIYK